MANNTIKEIKGFISYSHKDKLYFEKFKDILEDALKADQSDTKDFKISLWTDKEIPVGSYWHTEIQEQLEKSDFAILLVSNNFFASNYIQRNEYNPAKTQKKLFIPIELLPVIRRDQFTDIGQIQWFEHIKFSIGETLGYYFDTRPQEASWKQSYINDFLNSLHTSLKKYILKNPDSVQGKSNNFSKTNAISKVKDFPHIQAHLSGTPMRELRTVTTNDLVVIASNRMTQYNIRHILVKDGDSLVGIISKRDVVKLQREYKIINNTHNNNTTLPDAEFKNKKVNEVMSKNIISCDVEEDIIQILNKLVEKQFIKNKRISIEVLPVMSESKAIEIISYTDVLSYLDKILGDKKYNSISFKSSDIMTKQEDLHCLHEEDIMAFAYDIVVGENPKCCIPIVSKDNPKILKGMISDIRIFSVYNNMTEIKAVKDFMREKGRDLTNYFSKDTSFRDMVTSFINEKDLTSLPVVEGEELLGVVSYIDILKTILNQYKNENP